MKPFEGIFTPIVTPFRSDDTVDEPAMRRNVERWMRTPLTGLVVLGSTGEAAQLDDDEADRVVNVVREGVPRDRPLIAGTGRESTRATIAATRRAADAGVDAVLVRTPSFFKPHMTTDVFVQHYRRVADASPVPVLLYNVSVFTGVNLSPDAVRQLSEHPNIAGIKESGSDIGAISDLVGLTPDAFTVLAGSATTFFQALCAGCDGGILALAALVPDRCVEMRALVRDNRIADARRLQRELLPLARLIGGQYGVSALKAALDVLGYEGGMPRPPLRAVGPDVGDVIRRAVARA
jgi:4-hydroxy-2-oxoglutarate aldolase